MSSNHLVLCWPFSSCLQSCPKSGSSLMSQLFTPRGQRYWNLSFNISPSNEHPGLISFRMTGWISLQSKGLKSLLQHRSSEASILLCSAFFMVLLSHPYLTTGKAKALMLWTFVRKVMSLLFNMLSRLFIAFLPRCKCL